MLPRNQSGTAHRIRSTLMEGMAAPYRLEGLHGCHACRNREGTEFGGP